MSFPFKRPKFGMGGVGNFKVVGTKRVVRPFANLANLWMLAEQLKPYERHSPEKTILYQVIQENFDSFVREAQRKTDNLPFPMHVYQEVEEYLKCGILAYGFTRISCESCRKEKLVAFSCKRRGFCPSCGGRRMNEVASHLVDAVLPHVSVRQWVLSLPFSVRYLLS